MLSGPDRVSVGRSVSGALTATLSQMLSPMWRQRAWTGLDRRAWTGLDQPGEVSRWSLDLFQGADRLFLLLFSVDVNYPGSGAESER